MDDYENGVNTHLDYPISVEALPEDDYYGFEIDGNHRFVLGDFTVTHNTIMALKIISLVGKKTLILVHKEFLMNQWIERMADFLPTAKIGKIQAQTFDVEGKDVVIGMIQTLYDKVYPANTFASFGLTIIDEVHRIGSEQFSRTLLQTVTPYMLGISATVDRKDGLTDVLYHFIGPKIYSESRENDDKVCVRAIEYVCADAEFNEVEMDFRGNPAYSKMISKLSSYTPRTEFVVRVLRDLLEEQEDSQIMVLAHQRELLRYIHDAVVARGIADGSVGYYVGGMKETALKVTEGKQIVLATYAMAAEALDIKSLSTLVMITPKTDIIQSVGRILRMKHDNPIVVDIVDKHDNFQKQWMQRRRFYKKCNYRIRQIASTEYAGMDLDWDRDRSWKWVFEPKGGSSATTCVVEENGSEEEEDEAEKKPKSGGCLIGASALAELEAFHEQHK
jgi:superfamily II DNA or RNA helicase